MSMQLHSRSLLAAQRHDCNAAPAVFNADRARVILNNYASHGPKCRQYLAALSALSSVVG